MFGSVMRRVLASGLSIALFTKEKAEDLVNEFVRDGAVSRAEADRIIDDLVEKAQAQRAELRSFIVDQVSKVIEGAGFIRRDEYEALLRRVATLEKALHGTAETEKQVTESGVFAKEGSLAPMPADLNGGSREE